MMKVIKLSSNSNREYAFYYFLLLQQEINNFFSGGKERERTREKVSFPSASLFLPRKLHHHHIELMINLSASQ